MILHKKSWYFRLHQLLYSETAKSPSNFCPFFWKTIMLGLVLIVPLVLICLPMLLFDWIRSKVQKDDDYWVYESGLLSSYFFICILVDIVVMLGYSMIAMWFRPWGKEPDVIQCFGITGILIVVILIGVLLENKWSKWKEKKRAERWRQGRYKPSYVHVPEKEKGPNVFVEYIKAWYKKNCPMIDWKN